MPFDGAVARCVADEMRGLLVGGRVEKVFQPERDEIHVLIRNRGETRRVLVSVNASCARACLTSFTKENPSTAPLFCMILRKHIGGGRVADVRADGFERVVAFVFETATELGDITRKTLYAETMGRHSNAILVNDAGVVIDSLVHVDERMSSVRAVMPARPYAPPPGQGKPVPGSGPIRWVGARCRFEAQAQEQAAQERPQAQGMAPAPGTAPLWQAVRDSLMGFGPLLARECAVRAGLPPDMAAGALGAREAQDLEAAAASIAAQILEQRYEPCVVVGKGGEPEDFCCLPAGDAARRRPFGSMSLAIEACFDARGRAESLRQRKASLSKLVATNAARCKRKLAIQQESLREAAGRGTLRLLGELVTANIHAIPPGARSARLLDYNSGAHVDVPLDADLSPQANAQRYFKKYRKAESTWRNAQAQSQESARELEYLESVAQELDMCESAQEIEQIREELASQRYLPSAAGRHGAGGARGARAGGQGGKRGGGGSQGGKQGGKQGAKLGGARGGGGSQGGKQGGARGGGRQGVDAGAGAAPRRFVSSDGLPIYVGRNNRQNDHLTLRMAAANDIWLHAKDMPGSHVLVRKAHGDVPERTIAEAASLAAYFSKARMGGGVSVDCTAARHVKKPAGAKPGMVVYENHRTVVAEADEALARRLEANAEAGAEANAAAERGGGGE